MLPYIVGTPAGADATSMTLPTHQVGDVIFACAFRDGNTTNPTIPAGWTNISNTIDGTSCSLSIASKVATSNAEASGTWTNATSMCALVVRNADIITPLITSSNTNGVLNSINYAAIAENVIKAASGILGFAFCCHRSTDVTIETPPAGMTNIFKFESAAADLAIHQINADEGWPSTVSASITGTASGNITVVCLVRGARMTGYNDGWYGWTAGASNAGVLSLSKEWR